MEGKLHSLTDSNTLIEENSKIPSFTFKESFGKVYTVYKSHKYQTFLKNYLNRNIWFCLILKVVFLLSLSGLKNSLLEGTTMEVESNIHKHCNPSEMNLKIAGNLSIFSFDKSWY